MKKILFYTDTPIHGGAERHMLQLAKHLPKAKYTIELACSNYKQLNEWCKEWIAAGFKVHRLKVAHKHDPRTLLQFKKILKSTEPDLVHLHLWNPGGCRYAFGAIDKRSIKIVSTEHDPFPISGLKKSVKKTALKKTDHTITVSDANKQLMLKMYPEVKGKISTIHNGIDLQQFDQSIIRFSTQAKDKIREQIFQADHDDFIILTIAELHPRNGLNYLIEAFKTIQEQKPKTKLVIVGKGPQKAKLEKLIKKLELSDSVVLAGHQDDIPQILKSANLFVLPSVKEAFGLVLLEAMAAQLPIIATEVGGIPEIVQNHKSGELVPAQDYELLADKILAVMSNNALMQKLAYMGHHRVKTFDVTEMVRKTENIYDTLIK